MSNVVVMKKPDCVVVDTNIWRSDLLLKNPMGVSLLYTLRRQNGFLGLPEIIESEITRQIIELGLEAVEGAEKWTRILSTLTGYTTFQLPTEQSLKDVIKKHLTDLAPLFIRIPFTLEHAKAALQMVNDKLPPNAKSQQFKDSAAWQAILSIPAMYSVHFVTKDKAFWSGGDTKLGLAENLKNDCDDRGLQLELHSDIPSCLESIQSGVPSFDDTNLQLLIIEAVLPKVRTEAERQRYKLKEDFKASLKVFRTGEEGKLAVDFTVTGTWEMIDDRFNERYYDCRAIAYGGCYYDLASGNMSGFFVQRVSLVHRSGRGGWGQALRSFENDEQSNPFHRRIERFNYDS